MDIEMPGMNGLEAFTAIREDPQLQHVPIIALTASAFAHDLETILAHGFDAHLVKPIDATLFFAMIDEALYGK
jgi:CheY-like chemotaxis protein